MDKLDKANLIRAGVVYADGVAQSYFYDDVTKPGVDKLVLSNNDYIIYCTFDNVQAVYDFLELMQLQLRLPEIEV